MVNYLMIIVTVLGINVSLLLHIIAGGLKLSKPCAYMITDTFVFIEWMTLTVHLASTMAITMLFEGPATPKNPVQDCTILRNFLRL